MPIGLSAQIESTFDGVVHTRTWLEWYRVEFHPRLSEALVTFTVVTGLAAGDNIRPLMSTTPAAWHDVIDREVLLHPTAVLTGEMIADEYLTTAKLDARPGPTHKCPQSNDRGHLE